MRPIDADPFIKWVQECGKKCPTLSVEKLFNKLKDTQIIDTVTHGHWIDTGSGEECSCCREVQYGYDSFRNYCANCGAKIDEVSDQ